MISVQVWAILLCPAVAVVLVVRCLGGPRENIIHLSLQENRSPHFPAQRRWASRGPLWKRLLSSAGRGVSRLLLVKQRQHSMRTVLAKKKKKAKQSSLVAGFSHPLIPTLVHLGFLVQRVEKVLSIYLGFQTNQHTVFTRLSLYNQVHCYLFYWQAPRLGVCQIKGKMALEQSWKPL